MATTERLVRLVAMVTLSVAILGECDPPDDQTGSGSEAAIAAAAAAKNARRVELLHQTLSKLKEATTRAPHQLVSAQQLHETTVGISKRSSSNSTPRPEQQTIIVDPMLTRRQPKYMDACNRRLEEAVANASLNRGYHPDYPRFSERLSSTSSIEVRKQEILNHFVTKFRNPSEGTKRSKRSIVWHASNYVLADTDDNSISARNARDDGRGFVHFRTPKGGQNQPAATAKRTSFVIHRHKNQPALNKNRYLYTMAPNYANGHQAAAPNSQPSKQSPPSNSSSSSSSSSKPTATSPRVDQAQINSLAESLNQLDLRAAFRINCIKNTVNHIKSMPMSFVREIDREMVNQGLVAGQELVKRANDQLRQWMPSVESLTNVTGQPDANKQETSEALTNLAHQMQFFNLLLEQMVFEQGAKDKNFTEVYVELEKVLLRLLCDIETLIRLLAQMNDTLIELKALKARNNNQLNIRKYSAGMMENIEHKLRNATPRAQRIESPFDIGFGRQQRSMNSKLLLKRDGQEVYLKREAMPEEQRYLPSSLDRMLRDQIIFKDLGLLLGHLDTILGALG